MLRFVAIWLTPSCQNRLGGDAPRGNIGNNPALARRPPRRPRRHRPHRPPVRPRGALVAAAAGQPRHRRAQPAPQAHHPALQARPPAPADRAADVRSRGAEGGGGRGQGPRRAQERHARAGQALCQGDRAGLQRLHLFPRRGGAGQVAVDRALSRARGRLRGGRALQGAAGCLCRVRHQSSLQHGLRARHLSGVRELGAELRGGRVGPRVGAAGAHPRHGRLFRAPRQLQCALSQSIGALRAHGDRVRRHAGGVPRRRAHARREAAAAEAGAAQLHGLGLRPQRRPRHRLRARRHQLRPRAGGSRAHRRRLHAGRRASALRLQSAGADGVDRARACGSGSGGPGTATATPASASAGPCRCAATWRSAASTSAPCPRPSASPRSSSWGSG